MKLFTNVYMVQGTGAWGMIQVFSNVLCFGESDPGPRWQLILFRPRPSRTRFEFVIFKKNRQRYGCKKPTVFSLSF